MIAIMFFVFVWGCGNMAFGLQIFDENGNIILDTSTETTYVLGSGTTGHEDGYIQNAKFLTGYPWYAVSQHEDVISEHGVEQGYCPYFVFEGDKLRWIWPQNPGILKKLSVDFIYGVT